MRNWWQHLIIFGGVTKRFPSLDICISHGGAQLCFTEAFRLLAERRPSSPEWIRKTGEFDKELDNLWFDCHVSGQMEFDFAMSQLNTDRLVFEQISADGIQGLHYPSEMIEKLNTNAKTLLRLDATT